MKPLLLALTLLVLFAVPVAAQDPTPTPAPTPVLIFIRDQAWQFAGFVVGAVAIFISIWLYLKGRQRKVLTYETVALFPILKVNSELKSRVKILVDNSPVKQAWVLRFRLTNTGNAPILKDDFVDPVTIRFAPGVDPLSIETFDTNIPNLPVAAVGIKYDDCYGVVFSNTLFNEREYVSVQILLDAPEVKFTVTGRAVGTRIIKAVDRSRIMKRASLYVALGFITAMTIVVLLASYNVPAILVVGVAATATFVASEYFKVLIDTISRRLE